MPKYRKKLIVEAVQLRWDTWHEMCTHADIGRFEDGHPQGCWVDPRSGEPVMGPDHPERPARTPIDPHSMPSVITDHEIGLMIPTLEGVMIARENDWVIRDIAGSFYPCKPQVFESTYEPVTDKEEGE